MSEYVERIFLHNFSETSIMKTVLINTFLILSHFIYKENSMNTHLFGRPPPNTSDSNRILFLVAF